nr:hypothetical transcript [Hymenolepis microstoma]
MRGEPSVPNVPVRSSDLEPDDDFFFSDDPAVEALLQEIDFSPQSDHGAPHSPGNSTSSPSAKIIPIKRPCLSSDQQVSTVPQKQPMYSSGSTLGQRNFAKSAKIPTTAPLQKQMVFQQPTQSAPRTLAVGSTSLVQNNIRSVMQPPLTTSSQADIRRYLGSGGPQQHPIPDRSSASGEEAQNPIPAFAYLQDIYHNMQQRRNTRGGEIASIRGMLVSIQSRLEHHEGTHWSLTVRLSDGTATVDADFEDDLLRRLIGLSAVEAEAMRRLGRQGDELSSEDIYVAISMLIGWNSSMLNGETQPSVPNVPVRSSDLEPDDDFFFSDDPAVEALLQEIDFSPQSDHGAPHSPGNSTSSPSAKIIPIKRPCLSSDQQVSTVPQKQPMYSSGSTLGQRNFAKSAKIPTTAPLQKQMVFQQPTQSAPRTLAVGSTSLVQNNIRSVMQPPLTTSSQADIRRYLGSGGPQQHPIPDRSSASGEEAQNPIPAFAYLQDIYHNMQQRRNTRGGEIASIRGMLVSIQSRLEHHEGTHWSLTVRLSDGTATVDADFEDDLLRRLIGLSAVEAEAMRRLGRQGDEVRLFLP